MKMYYTANANLRLILMYSKRKSEQETETKHICFLQESETALLYKFILDFFVTFLHLTCHYKK